MPEARFSIRWMRPAHPLVRVSQSMVNRPPGTPVSRILTSLRL